MSRRLFAPDLIELFIKGMNEVYPAIHPVSSSSANDLQSLIESILPVAEHDFGNKSACGLFFRSGGAAFKHLVRQHGKSIGIDSLDFRLQPQQKRLVDGTTRIVNLLASWQAGSFAIQKTGDLIEIVTSSDLTTDNDSLARIWLHFFAGLFQEYLGWAGNGKQYPFQIIPLEHSGGKISIQFRIVPVD